MRGPKPPAVVLTEEERAELERLVNRHATAQQVALRARIVLAAADGQRNSPIARHEGVDVETVRRWRGRWLALQVVALADLSVGARLTDAPRPGAPARITHEQVCRILEVACAAPDTTGRPISQWSSREVADDVIRRGIVDHISPRHAARLLKGGQGTAAPRALLADALR